MVTRSNGGNNTGDDVLEEGEEEEAFVDDDLHEVPIRCTATAVRGPLVRHAQPSNEAEPWLITGPLVKYERQNRLHRMVR